MMWALAVPLLLQLLFAVTASTASNDDKSLCQCYLTDGSESSYYTSHKFFDFRSLSQHAGLIPAINDSREASDAPESSPYFSSDEWTDTWSLQNWSNSDDNGDLSGDAAIFMVNSLSNVYIQSAKPNDSTTADVDTFLAVRTHRAKSFQSAAEFESSSKKYHYMSLRMLSRTVGSPGAVSAMFTYRDSSDPALVQEADIEILTSGPRDRIQYTNQPSYLDGHDIPRSTRNATLPDGGEWTDWAVHRLDWTPERSTWYFNGEEAARIEFQVPRDDAGVNFNVWGDGGSWSGKMRVGNEAVMQIQWIEMVYNMTGKDDGGNEGCQVVCSVDETDEAGHPVEIWSSAAPRPRPVVALGYLNVAGWVCAVMVGILVI